MAAAKKTKVNSVESEVIPTDESTDAFVQTMIKELNKDFQQKIAWNLSTDESPTHVKRWISTGSRLLDYAIANRRDGGLPEGRIVELYGPPSIGKSHIATHVAKSTQKMGGIVVYIDTENATNPENLALLGVDVSKRFIYSDPACTEDVFSVIEATIEKVKQIKKDIPLTIIWDSLAAVPPKAELLADYDKDSIGLQARALSKGMRKVTQVIANNNVLLLILNQTRTKIGVMYGDPTVTPGGSAVPFHASVRISLTGGSKIDNGKEEMIGINVIARTVKNKINRPFRKVEFAIHFGKGIVEHEQMFDLIKGHCKENGAIQRNGKIMLLEGEGGWKTLTICDGKTGEVEIERKFSKRNFDTIIADPQCKDFIDEMLDATMTHSASQSSDDEVAKKEAGVEESAA